MSAMVNSWLTIRVPYDNAAKAVIEASVGEADAMGEAQVSELHLLLALAAHESEDGVLRHFGFDPIAARGTAEDLSAT